MSSNNGKVTYDMKCARVAAQPTFYPAYRDAAGIDKSQRLRIPMAVNSRQGKVQYFDCIAWGKRTVLAHYITVGKELHLDGRLSNEMVSVRDNTGKIVYQKASGREKDMNGNPYAVGMDIPIQTPRSSCVIEGWLFGADSAAVEAKRPVGWNVQGSAGQIAWKAELERIKQIASLSYQGGDTFGNAKVGAVNGTAMTHDANGNLIPLQANLIHNPNMAGAGAAGHVPPPPDSADAQLLAALRAAGWRDDQIAANADYARLLQPASTHVPAPPADATGYAGAPTGV